MENSSLVKFIPKNTSNKFLQVKANSLPLEHLLFCWLPPLLPNFILKARFFIFWFTDFLPDQKNLDGKEHVDPTETFQIVFFHFHRK